MTKKHTWTFALLAAALTVTLATSGLVMGKGKPVPEPEPDPPVKYTITWMTHPDGSVLAKDINSNGDVVGFISGGNTAFFYSQDDEFLYDLHTLVNPNDLLDANDEPLVIEYAMAINDSGQIAGAAKDINGELQAFRLTLSGDANVYGIFELLGKPDSSDQDALPEEINNDGDICGDAMDVNGVIYAFYYTDKDRDEDGKADRFVVIPAGTHAADINDAGQVVGWNSEDGTAFLYTPGQTTKLYSSPDGSGAATTASAINIHGQFVGRTQFVTPKGNSKFKSNYQAYRCIDDLNLEDLGSDLGFSGTGINQDGDILFSSQGVGMIYYESLNTIINLDDAVTGPETPDWLGKSIRASNINDAGMITGWGLGGGNAWGFILTPIDPPPTP